MGDCRLCYLSCPIDDIVKCLNLSSSINNRYYKLKFRLQPKKKHTKLFEIRMRVLYALCYYAMCDNVNKIKFKLNRAKKLICSYISTISQCGSLHHIEIMCAKSHRLVYFFKQFRCCASIWSVKSSLVIIFFLFAKWKRYCKWKITMLQPLLLFGWVG